MTSITVQDVQRIQEKIVDILAEFPNITRTMLASHVASHARYYNVDWAVILDSMIDLGVVIREARIKPDSNRATIVHRLA